MSCVALSVTNTTINGVLLADIRCLLSSKMYLNNIYIYMSRDM